MHACDLVMPALKKLNLLAQRWSGKLQ